MWRRWAALAAAGVSSLLVCSLGLELGMRLLGFEVRMLPRPGQGDRGLWVYDATKGWFHAPGSTGRAALGGPDAGDVRINRLGLRGPELRQPREPGTQRVLVLGDSFVFGVGVDEAHLFVTRLEQVLTRREGRRFEVVNAGVSGYSTDQELILLEELGPRLRPDVVLLVMCDNDFAANTQDFAYNRYYKPYFELADSELVRRNVPAPRLSPGQRVKLALGMRSRAWNLVRTRHSRWAPLQRGLDWFQVGIPRDSGADPLEITAALTVAARDLAARLDAAFLTVNTGHRTERTEWFQRLRPRLRAAGVAYVGLEGALGTARRKHPEQPWEFPRDAHWNVAAQARAADELAPYVAAALANRPRGARSR